MNEYKFCKYINDKDEQLDRKLDKHLDRKFDKQDYWPLDKQVDKQLARQATFLIDQFYEDINN
jgi:hypothetical protein